MGQIRGDQRSIQSHVEQLRKRLAEQVDRTRMDLARSSSVPSDAFDLQDPMLEAALTDSAMQFFLGHMTAFENLSGAIEADVTPRHEAISIEELRATFERVARFESHDPPDLLSQIDTERFWIVADLVTKGDTLSRHRATVELRQIMDRARTGDISTAEAEIYLEGLQARDKSSLLFELLARSLENRLRGCISEVPS